MIEIKVKKKQETVKSFVFMLTIVINLSNFNSVCSFGFMLPPCFIQFQFVLTKLQSIFCRDFLCKYLILHDVVNTCIIMNQNLN